MSTLGVGGNAFSDSRQLSVQNDSRGKESFSERVCLRRQKRVGETDRSLSGEVQQLGTSAAFRHNQSSSVQPETKNRISTVRHIIARVNPGSATNALYLCCYTDNAAWIKDAGEPGGRFALGNPTRGAGIKGIKGVGDRFT